MDCSVSGIMDLINCAGQQAALKRFALKAWVKKKNDDDGACFCENWRRSSYTFLNKVSCYEVLQLQIDQRG